MNFIHPEKNVQGYTITIWTSLCQRGEKAGKHNTEDIKTQEPSNIHIEMQRHWIYPSQSQHQMPNRNIESQKDHRKSKTWTYKRTDKEYQQQTGYIQQGKRHTGKYFILKSRR